MIARKNWLSPAKDAGFGISAQRPRWFYRVGGKEGEYDVWVRNISIAIPFRLPFRRGMKNHPTSAPRVYIFLTLTSKTNDEVWEAMEPALMLVTRVLKEKPEFLNGLLSIWDHKIVPPQRDNRPQCEKSSYPLRTFDTVPTSESDPSVWPDTQFLRPIGEKFISAAWGLLAKELRFILHGGIGQLGATYTPRERFTDWENNPPTIDIVINAKLVFPLLVPGYSQSEKTMASFSLANTILHEIGVSIIALQPPTQAVRASNSVTARVLLLCQDRPAPS